MSLRLNFLISALLMCFCLQAQAASNRPPLMVGLPLNTPPLAFLNDRGEVRGLSVDVATMLGALLKREVRFVQDTFPVLRQRLMDGTLDFVSATPQPPMEAQHLRPLITPFALNRHILVGSPEAHVTCEQDFPGQRIGVLEGDTYFTVITGAGGNPVVLNSYQDGLSRLVQGKIDAFVAPSGEVASYEAQRNNLQKVRIMGLSLERLPLSISVNDANSGLISDLTSALVRLEAEGTLDLLREKWLGRPLLGSNFWEMYQRHIFTGTGVALALVLLVAAWIITMRRQIHRTTRRLINSERRYRDLIEASPDMTLLVDSGGKICLANRIARETLGMDRGYETGPALWNALCEQGRDCLRDLLHKAGHEPQVRTEIVLHPDSESKQIMEFIAFPSDTSTGSDALICCIGRDMTARRQLEQELVEVERLAVIGKMAASVAHEINNPLGIIMANTDVALEECADPAQRPLLEAIHRNVERAATTTRRLLNIAMPPAINNVPQNLGDIIREALAFLAPRTKTIAVDVSGLEPELLILGDRILLEQLFINLLLNAVTSMEREGAATGALIINGHTLPGKRMFRIVIQDTGCGIAPENIQRIFDPFFTTRGSQGFGLGLFISRRIVEAHGGAITVLSNQAAAGTAEQGTKMIVDFPLCGADENPECPGED